MPPLSEHSDGHEPIRPLNAGDLFEVKTALEYHKGVEILDSFEASRNETIQSIIELLNAPYDFQRQDALGIALDQLTVTFARRIKNIDENADDKNDRASSVAHLLVNEEKLIKVAFSDAINSCSKHGMHQYDEATMEMAITVLYNSYEADSPELLERLATIFVEDVSIHIAHALDVHSPTTLHDTEVTSNPTVHREIAKPKETQHEPRKLGRGILKAASLGIIAAGGVFVARRFFGKSK